MKTSSEKPETSTIATDDLSYIKMLLLAVLNDAFNLLRPCYRSVDYARDVQTIENRLSSEGIGFATTTLPSFFNEFALHLEGGLPSFASFKKPNKASQLPAFLRGLTSMVTGQGEQAAHAFKAIYCLCVSFKKLKGDYKESVLSDNLDKFIKTDEEIGKIQFQNYRTILNRARGYITEVFKSVNINLIKPKPGPGAVNDPVKPYLRYEPHVRYAQLEDAFHYPFWFYSNAFGFAESVRKYNTLKKRVYPKSRFKFVHKYANKPRGICIEQNETQYLQQGLKNLLYNTIENHSMTKGRVNFKSQAVNQKLALSSSLTKSFCTIDMSEGSNRIPRDLVFYLFLHTDLLDMLNALSTRIIEFTKPLNHADYIANMFAPMGSAICFPIMSIVHFALCKAIIRSTHREGCREACKKVYVYGDDILLPAEYTEVVYDYLPKFGMKINQTKSYYKSSFRESCGVHAYAGHDVTPVYNNYTLTINSKTTDSTRLLSSLSKEALYHKLGMKISASVVRKHIRFVYGQLPYVGESSSILGFIRPRSCNNWWSQYEMAKRCKYDKALRSHTYLLRCVVPRFENNLSLLGSPALLRWFNQGGEDAASFAEFDELKIVHKYVNEASLG